MKNDDLFNRSKWRIRKEIDDIANDDVAKERKQKLDDIQFQRELREELNGMEVLLHEI